MGRFFGGKHRTRRAERFFVSVGAGVVRSGVGTLASPWQEEEGVYRARTRATQQYKASPLHTTLPPPLRGRRGFRGTIAKYLPL